MTYEEALAAMVRGEKAQRAGKTFRFTLGIHDVTDAENPKRVDMTDEDVKATDWVVDTLQQVSDERINITDGDVGSIDAILTNE